MSEKVRLSNALSKSCLGCSEINEKPNKKFPLATFTTNASEKPLLSAHKSQFPAQKNKNNKQTISYFESCFGFIILAI